MPTSSENWTYNETTHKWIPTILGCSEIDDVTDEYASDYAEGYKVNYFEQNGQVAFTIVTILLLILVYL